MLTRPKSTRRHRRLAAAAVVVALGVGPAAARDKVDVVTLSNGDRVTGEIKQLALGELQVKTHLMDTVQIDWVGVTSIDSPQHFEVEDAAGTKHFGTITTGQDQGLMLIAGPDGEVTLGHDNIVAIAQIEETFVRRLSGHVNLGFNIAAANNQTNLTLDASTTYRSEKSTWNGSLSSSISDRDDADRSARSLLGTSYQRSIRGNTFWVNFAQLENNQELDLDLRVTLGAGFGRYLIRNVRSELSLIAAPAGIREQYAAQESAGWTVELLLGCKYDLFLFGGHETRLSSSLGVLPSLSSWGRYRIELNGSISRKITSDLSISLSLYESYDNDPPSTDSAGNDWGATTSLGWNF